MRRAVLHGKAEAEAAPVDDEGAAVHERRRAGEVDAREAHEVVGEGHEPVGEQHELLEVVDAGDLGGDDLVAGEELGEAVADAARQVRANLLLAEGLEGLRGARALPGGEAVEGRAHAEPVAAMHRRRIGAQRAAQHGVAQGLPALAIELVHGTVEGQRAVVPGRREGRLAQRLFELVGRGLRRRVGLGRARLALPRAPQEVRLDLRVELAHEGCRGGRVVAPAPRRRTRLAPRDPRRALGEEPLDVRRVDARVATAIGGATEHGDGVGGEGPQRGVLEGGGREHLVAVERELRARDLERAHVVEAHGLRVGGGLLAVHALGGEAQRLAVVRRAVEGVEGERVAGVVDDRAPRDAREEPIPRRDDLRDAHAADAVGVEVLQERSVGVEVRDRGAGRRPASGIEVRDAREVRGVLDDELRGSAEVS